MRPPGCVETGGQSSQGEGPTAIQLDWLRVLESEGTEKISKERISLRLELPRSLCHRAHCASIPFPPLARCFRVVRRLPDEARLHKTAGDQSSRRTGRGMGRARPRDRDGTRLPHHGRGAAKCAAVCRSDKIPGWLAHQRRRPAHLALAMFQTAVARGAGWRPDVGRRAPRERTRNERRIRLPGCFYARSLIPPNHRSSSAMPWPHPHLPAKKNTRWNWQKSRQTGANKISGMRSN